MKATKSSIRNTKFISKVMGMRETKEIAIEGRVIMDMYHVIVKDHKLS